ncbi:hypothetical protein [Leptolyngbya sp. AN02str]|uniref:hypothetical protein n=1 Tax=Leptolyngbya sp. AN02str TaxID=3423363 RepID=UPI003D321F0A
MKDSRLELSQWAEAVGERHSAAQCIAPLGVGRCDNRSMRIFFSNCYSKAIAPWHDTPKPT